MTTDKNFKMSKSSKRMIASISSKEGRNAFKQVIANAQATEERARRTSMKSKESKDSKAL
jgi:hypothetical protein